eukprot:TRINITY_DN2209_c1_g1_i1.p1 TRINITY_DN2209_c1_g1~~TRINITY_DN2209_c1_g1_i1.p1  ORF type:complete len:128 (+),score=0.99 TRINITY_DN2209_c1_g1_i1:611-994(+)
MIRFLTTLENFLVSPIQFLSIKVYKDNTKVKKHIKNIFHDLIGCARDCSTHGSTNWAWASRVETELVHGPKVYFDATPLWLHHVPSVHIEVSFFIADICGHRCSIIIYIKVFKSDIEVFTCACYSYF